MVKSTGFQPTLSTLTPILDMPHQPFATETIFRINRPEQIVIVEGDNILNIINMLFMAEGYYSLLNLKAITKLRSRDDISRGSGEGWGVAGGNPPPMLGEREEVFQKIKITWSK